VLKVTVDTNVLVSALVFGRGKPHQLLQKALSGEISLTVSKAIVDEVADVLGRKFGASAEDIAIAQSVIADAARTVRPAVELYVIKEDPADNRILECAVSAGEDYLVTGDKDLLRLKRYDSIRILSVTDFLQIAEKHAGGVNPD
jgi:putative PIN family toxin of toxin-antitoxin system